MKLLLSQYRELQNNADDKMLPLKSSGNKKNISKKLENHVKETTDVTNHSMVLRSRQTDRYNATYANASKIVLLIDNFDKPLKKLNIVVEFTHMDSLWLTQVYKTYENDLWRKELNYRCFGQNKYIFYCGLCSKKYKEFVSMKSHLNKHFDFYPYVCKLCLIKYTSRKSATRHLKVKHQLNCEQWNNFLTS